jgi:DNA-binding transcriptional LysR family regulator
VNSLAHARQIARDSDALFPCTAALLEDDVAAGVLIRLNCRVPEMRTTYGVLYLRDRTLAPAARIFIETLRAVEAEAKKSEVTSPSAVKAAAKRLRHASARR